MLVTAKAIRAYTAQEGAVDPRFDELVVDQVRLDEIVQVYQRVRSQGLTAEELSQLVALGLTDGRSLPSARSSTFQSRRHRSESRSPTS